MLLSVQLPGSVPVFQTCVIRAIHVSPGAPVEPGSKLVDFSVDLTASQSNGCTPVAHYRVVSAESGLMRGIDVAVGQEIEATAVIGHLSIEGDTGDEGPARAARVTVASIVHNEGWWDEL
jgi:hypothetical protein